MGLAAAVCMFVLGAAGAVLCHATLHVRRIDVSPLAFADGSRDVSIEARDGVRLRAWFLPAAQPSGRCVVILHGIADSRTGAVGFAPMFRASGYSVLTPDSRAHGTSGGELVTYGLLEKYDALDWAHWLRGAGCTAVYGLGESLGAAVLIQASAVEPAFRAIVAECPFVDLKTIAQYRVGQMSHLPRPFPAILVAAAMLYARVADGFDFRQASPLAAIARTSTPILLIHGLRDSRTPASNSEALARADPHAVLWLVPNAEHTGASSADPAEFRKRVLGWFAEH